METVHIVTISEYSDPYEPPLTRIDAIFSNLEIAKKWVEYRNGHVDALIRLGGARSTVEEGRVLSARYGFAMGCPVSREIMGENHEYFEIETREVWPDFTGEEYPDDVLWSVP